ncbi:MAG: PIG-L family deacetylase [Clostridia bacterium]|nr:PIG-L family deacetylase [Clostridia bacterium]
MEKLRILVIGAHPDDNDFKCGGIALKYIKAGHRVRFVSVTDGSAGHHVMGKEEIAVRRKKETEEVARITGIEYDVWDIPDGCVVATLENRMRMVRYIREYNPDIIFTHRTIDYHADHRNVAMLVQDSAYMLIVPNFCPDAPAMKKNPVIMFTSDRFINPPFVPDVVIPTDDVIDEKFAMKNCHVSQVYEWLPFTNGVLDRVPKDTDERLAWLRRPLVPRNGKVLKEKDLNVPLESNTSEYREAGDAVRYRKKLAERYGKKVAKQTLFAEAFQLSEYGSKLTKDNIDKLFPF